MRRNLQVKKRSATEQEEPTEKNAPATESVSPDAAEAVTADAARAIKAERTEDENITIVVDCEELRKPSTSCC